MLLTPAGVRRVRAWVGGALRLEAGDDAVIEPDASASPAELVAAVSRHRVVEVLLPHVEALGMPAQVAETLADLHEADRPRLMVHRLELARVADLLAGFDWLSLKGPALAVQTTGDPAARGSGDIDVVVRPADLESIHGLLTLHGWRPRESQASRPGTWAWRHLVSAYNEMTFDGPHSSVDVHWRLDPTHHGLPGFDAVWGRRQPVELDTLTIDTLGVGDAFTHTCHHAAMDGWRSVRSLVDVHRLLRRPEVQHVTLGRADAATVAVTSASVGLPSGVPEAVLARARRVPKRIVRRSAAAQERPTFAESPVPGVGTFRNMRYLLLASRSPGDLVRAAGAAVLPSVVVADLDDRTAWTALPRVLVRRVVSVVRRVARRFVHPLRERVAQPTDHR